MKKIWKCPHCEQMSSRHGNLKRHIGRKHTGIGTPILQYISGNSIFTPAVAPTYRYVLNQENDVFKRYPEDRIFHSNALRMENSSDWFYKNFEPVYKLMELQLKLNSSYGSLNPNPVKYFSPPTAPCHYSFISKTVHVTAHANSQIQGGTSRNYDGVTGFRAGICQKCLATIVMQTGTHNKNLSIQDIHKCDPNRADAIRKLDPIECLIDHITKINKIPELLFQECKDWANNTNGQLYLIARKIGPPDKSDGQNNEIQENYDALPFLNRVLAEPKIIPNDRELYEFLKLAKNQTATFVTLKGKPPEEDLKYMIAVSNVDNIEAKII
jgi:hypothetical protein